ncbi:threonine/homoserine/homoserine lactone efflux protein [Roseovarius halotolerans]|uniref:Threonine efflux protein n=1 Tax=Roseovarius halotolerans TaxID=505353 RepID=A0A1X6YTN1_9RHOB|nr:LysE family translocator [Roseovarius halotolerans]RKT32914.1 threonine/homoserine/homoserine lactone efflux protein [Roseovarius halotolerans]SLN30925.1 Threonine efflux protein [Roseovarius halotolerans]
MTWAETGLVLAAWLVAAGSPGPATLAISATSMGSGRAAGLALALGVACGSATWGVAAALGMSAVMLAHAWVFEVVRLAGAVYLIWLALKSLRRVLRPVTRRGAEPAQGQLFLRGMLLHLTNPKAILAWGAIYALVLPGGAGAQTGAGAAHVWQWFAMLLGLSVTIFVGYAMLFSIGRVARGYARAQRAFDAVFAVLFGAAGVKLLTMRLE